MSKNQTPEELAQKVADTKAKYGANHWWESDDPRTLGYYQLMQPIFLLDDFGRFHEALETLLGRGVQTFEMAGFNIASLQAEAQAAWDGTPYTADQRAVAQADAFQKLIERKGADRVIVVETDEEGDK